MAVKSVNHQNHWETFNSKKCFCNKLLNLSKQPFPPYLRLWCGLKSDLSQAKTFSTWMTLSSSHHHSEMVLQSGLPIAQDILHLHWSRTNLFIARFVKASWGRISANVKCWGFQTGSVLTLHTCWSQQLWVFGQCTLGFGLSIIIEFRNAGTNSFSKPAYKG